MFGDERHGQNLDAEQQEQQRVQNFIDQSPEGLEIGFRFARHPLVRALAAEQHARAHHREGPAQAQRLCTSIRHHGERAKQAMSGETESYLKAFWTLVDEILNALLFLLLGVEILAVPFVAEHFGLLLAVVPLVVLSRFLVVIPWGVYLHGRGERGATAILG